MPYEVNRPNGLHLATYTLAGWVHAALLGESMPLFYLICCECMSCPFEILT
jgi:hypothetical protein